MKHHQGLSDNDIDEDDDVDDDDDDDNHDGHDGQSWSNICTKQCNCNAEQSSDVIITIKL